MCASSQPLASQAGAQVLREGGTAADAAVAMAAVLAVTEPCSTGIGGDALGLFLDGATGKVEALVGVGRAPQHLTRERLQAAGVSTLEPTSPFAVTVPGAPAAWCDAVERFGSGASAAARARVLETAIRLAEGGAPISPVSAHHWRRAEAVLRSSPGGHALLVDGERAPRVGEVFRNPDLARTLRLVAQHGVDGFYRGPVAAAICERLAAVPMLPTDLEAHTSEVVRPLWADYRGKRVYEVPSPAHGLAVLIALRVLEGVDLHAAAGEPHNNAAYLDVLIRAMRIGFAVAAMHVADHTARPDACTVCGGVTCAEVCYLLSDAYIDDCRKRMLAGQTLDDPGGGHTAPETIGGRDTVQFCAVDVHGNACSFINSTCLGFGSGIVPNGCGFSLQNRGLGFSLDPSSPNCIGPGKRPYHTLIPALATHADTGQLYAAFGVMGGMMQPQGHLQVVLNMLEWDMDPQETLDAPRFCIESGAFHAVHMATANVALEEGISDATADALAAAGHVIHRRQVRGHHRAIFGRGQVIRRDPDSGVLWGGSDPRADGCAIPVL
ncbi:hypothetical protein CDCA_CDCA07G2096 [Cyanidium caldarium]|uniref:Gamma-glutamyltransferase n=1 Tax=Cyanidium caldarium TaxID=2771 RepID=A0AAV9IVF7_CYACA|nr:hypothetical protein CDCA_CDCA07G2096 [Cyanidium caldarium]